MCLQRASRRAAAVGEADTSTEQSCLQSPEAGDLWEGSGGAARGNAAGQSSTEQKQRDRVNEGVYKREADSMTKQSSANLT